MRQHLASPLPFARRSFPIKMFQPSSGLMPDPADFSEPDDEPCEFGEPPRHLLRAHHRPFINDFWRRIARAIEAPVEICLGFGIRRVQVLGQVVYEFAPDGTVSVQASSVEAPARRGARRSQTRGPLRLCHQIASISACGSRPRTAHSSRVSMTSMRRSPRSIFAT